MELNGWDYKRLNDAVDVLKHNAYDILAHDLKMIIRKIKRDEWEKMQIDRVEIDWERGKVEVFTDLYNTSFTYDMTEDFHLIEKNKDGMIKNLF